jgi:hypothetical protein
VRLDQIPGPRRAALKRRLPLPVMPQSGGRAYAAVCHVFDREFQRDQGTARRVSLIAASDTQFLCALRNIIDLPARRLCGANRRHELQPGRPGQVSPYSSHLDEPQTQLGENRRWATRLPDYQRSRKLKRLASGVARRLNLPARTWCASPRMAACRDCQTIWPGRASEYLPPSTTTLPLTITCSIPRAWRM